MPNDVGVLTQLLEAFVSVLTMGYGKITGDVYYLLYIFTTLEIILCAVWWAFDKKDILADGISKLLIIGFLFFLIVNWPTIIKEFLDSFLQMGAKVGDTSGTITYKELSNPSYIALYGLKVTEPMLTYMKGYSLFKSPSHLGDVIVNGLTMLLIVLCFFFIAWQLFLAHVEFWICAIFGMIFIPLYVFDKTRFLADGSFRAIIGQGARLMILSFIISVSLPIISAMSLPPDPNLQASFGLLLAAGAIALLAASAPQLGFSLVSGHGSAGMTGIVPAAGIGTSASVNQIKSAVGAAGKGIGKLWNMATGGKGGGSDLKAAADVGGGGKKS